MLNGSASGAVTMVGENTAGEPVEVPLDVSRITALIELVRAGILSVLPTTRQTNTPRPVVSLTVSPGSICIFECSNPSLNCCAQIRYSRSNAISLACCAEITQSSATDILNFNLSRQCGRIDPRHRDGRGLTAADAIHLVNLNVDD